VRLAYLSKAVSMLDCGVDVFEVDDMVKREVGRYVWKEDKVGSIQLRFVSHDVTLL